MPFVNESIGIVGQFGRLLFINKWIMLIVLLRDNGFPYLMGAKGIEYVCGRHGLATEDEIFFAAPKPSCQRQDLGNGHGLLCPLQLLLKIGQYPPRKTIVDGYNLSGSWHQLL